MVETPSSSRLRFSVHGLGVELTCLVPAALEPIGEALGVFSVQSLVGKGSPVRGVISPFDQHQVRLHLSPTARRVVTENDLLELYEEDERFWLIDDHWGLCEINVLRGQFRSWILPSTTVEPHKVIEQTLMWPLAQLLRPRGLCLIPAVSVVRDGWGALLLGTFSIEPELTAMVHAGFRVVGQCWTALYEKDGGIQMLALPGQVQRMSERIDLTREMSGSSCDRAACDAVMILAPGRRPLPYLRSVAQTNATTAVRRAWPIVELHPMRRPGHMPARLAHRCRVFDMQLSRNPRDVLSLLETARYHRPQNPAAPVAPERVVA